MRKRLVFSALLVLLAMLVTLVVWQSSFSFGEFGPTTTPQTYVLWAVSIFVFLLTVALGFLLFRTGLKLYVERQRHREGSRIRSRLVFGALALSFMPVLFLVLFSVSLLNYNLVTWFNRPVSNIRWSLIEMGVAMERETQTRAEVLAEMLGKLQDGPGRQEVCVKHKVVAAWAESKDGKRSEVCVPQKASSPRTVVGKTPLGRDSLLFVRLAMPLDLAARQQEINRNVAEYDEMGAQRKEVRNLYLLLLFLITLFILFVATWVAQLLARQISDPISAILVAADEIRRGNLGYRISASAMDELGTLVRAFNQMTQDLDTNSKELERRRRFTEAILESIPTGVVSLSPEGKVQRYNQALLQIFPSVKVQSADSIGQILPPDEAKEILYLMKRARRTGIASRQLDFELDRQTIHLAVTVAALEEKGNAGFVLVIEDTSELLRAQKAAAWHEVARRIAHEIKNPLTPIALSAERVMHQLERSGISPETSRIMRECCQTILGEVESVKTLVDEFSQFARFPAAQPSPCDLNEVVENAMAVFRDRLDGISVHMDLGSRLPPVNLDREQFKRVVVNLVDNAAEAMQDSLVRRVSVVTRSLSPEMAELIVSDTGHGVSPEDREKLFLPYFSTKDRGTGLGLAIVNHILAEHGAQIRVEDNVPAGARFIVEIPAIVTAEPEPRLAEAGA
ncbi:MAG: HAMP domain-containing protein [Candidatus Solibacter usitatus]|nr:HAMP domain-containing protein [Candidatus Solibacter usitatus]